MTILKISKCMESGESCKETPLNELNPKPQDSTVKGQFSEIKDSNTLSTVIHKFRDRERIGKYKYGTSVDRVDLSKLDWLTHLQEELMDAVLYLERFKGEINEEQS